MGDFELIDYLNSNGTYEEISEDEMNFVVDYIGEDWLK
jgi:hypothetical protein